MALDNELYITFSIYAPALSGYKVEILEYTQPVQMYPGTLKLNLIAYGNRVLVQDESEFEKP